MEFTSYRRLTKQDCWADSIANNLFADGRAMIKDCLTDYSTTTGDLKIDYRRRKNCNLGRWTQNWSADE